MVNILFEAVITYVLTVVLRQLQQSHPVRKIYQILN